MAEKVSFRGDRLRHLRLSKGFTQEEIYRRLNIGTTQQNRWEKGKAAPTTANLVALANFYMVSTDYLLGRSDSPNIVTGSLTSSELELLRRVREGATIEAMEALIAATKNRGNDDPVQPSINDGSIEGG